MFALDARLEADTFPLGESALSLLRVLDDSRYPWLVLIPKLPDSVEWFDLAPHDRTVLFSEAMQAGQALREAFPGTKVNVGQLGNVVRQLHVHVVARREGDPAWPGPVWGHSPRLPYTSGARERLVGLLRSSALRSPFELA